MTEKRAILALDQGTTSSRGLVFDEHARVLGAAQREFEQIYPRPGWIEHDPADIWNSQLATAREALERSGVHAEAIAAIGIANQRETSIVWDRRTGKPVSNAIVWQDRRTAALCDKLERDGLGSTVREKTGLVLDPYFSGTKIRWLLDNVEGVRERAERGDVLFGTVDSWLLWNLTSGRTHATDVTNASRTMLFDIRALAWDEDLCRALDIPQAMLPRVLPTTSDFGQTDRELFGVPIPICAAAGDQQAALAGQAGFAPGSAKNTYGTGSFLVLNTGDRIVRSEHGLIATIAFGLEPNTAVYALEGSVFITGAAVQWLRDGLKFFEHASEIEALASSVHGADGVFFVPAFAGLGAPYWDPNARGTIVGLTRGTTRAHIARATLEAIAYQTADVIEGMRGDSGITLSELRVDGGGSTNGLLMQMQADALGCAVARPSISETTALGAAYFAGLQSGFWPDLETVAAQWREAARFEPQVSEDRRASMLSEWRRAVERSRAWVSTGA